jgi:hypothetical protein
MSGLLSSALRDHGTAYDIAGRDCGSIEPQVRDSDGCRHDEEQGKVDRKSGAFWLFHVSRVPSDRALKDKASLCLIQALTYLT